jgi:hypothetical protein
MVRLRADVGCTSDQTYTHYLMISVGSQSFTNVRGKYSGALKGLELAAEIAAFQYKNGSPFLDGPPKRPPSK